MFEKIHNVTSSLISEIGSDDLFQQIVKNAQEISNAKFVILSFYDSEKGIIKPNAISGADSSLMSQVSDIFDVDTLLETEFPVVGTPRFEKFSEQKEKEILNLDGFNEYTFGLLNEGKCERLEEVTGIEGIMVAPLLNSEKELIGILAYLFKDENEDRNLELLMIFADLASHAIEKSRMFAEQKKRRAEKTIKENVNMTAEVMSASIFRKFGEKLPVSEMGLKRALEHLAEFAVEPSPPSVIFDFMTTGVQNNLRKVGIEAEGEEIRKVLSPHLKKFMMETFSLADDLDREVPNEYKEFEKQLTI